MKSQKKTFRDRDKRRLLPSMPPEEAAAEKVKLRKQKTGTIIKI